MLEKLFPVKHKAFIAKKLESKCSQGKLRQGTWRSSQISHILLEFCAEEWRTHQNLLYWKSILFSAIYYLLEFLVACLFQDTGLLFPGLPLSVSVAEKIK